MIRKIVDYQKLNDDILNLLVEKYPDGYDESDIITFRNAQNEVIEAVEVRTDDTVYLVKIGKRLVQAMEEFLEDDDEDEDDEKSVNFDDIEDDNGDGDSEDYE